MEDYYIHLMKDKLPNYCAGCKHCDFTAFLVSMPDEYYHGYDATSYCDAYSSKEDETNDNRSMISSYWPKCTKFEGAEMDDYIEGLAEHLAFALSEFPKTNGKTKQEVFDNVMSLYTETIKKYPPTNEIKYDPEFFDGLAEQYKNFYGNDKRQKTYKEFKKGILNTFKEKYYR